MKETTEQTMSLMDCYRWNWNRRTFLKEFKCSLRYVFTLPVAIILTALLWGWSIVCLVVGIPFIMLIQPIVGWIRCKNNPAASKKLKHLLDTVR